MTGVRQGDGRGAEDVEGVLEDERDTEGNDAVRQEVLSSENRAKPRAWASDAWLQDAWSVVGMGSEGGW